MLKVHTFPILEDNYGYLIEHEGKCIIVDPGEVDKVVAQIEQRGLQPVAIWNTHHHSDHVDGNAGLLSNYGSLPVVGSEGDRGRVAELTQFVKGGDKLEFGGESVEILDIPGHTRGHIAFYFPASGHLFSGDLMFGYSCGKIFEGTFEQMYTSMAQLLNLPDETLVYCGHEYTLGNAKFAQAVLGDDPHLKRRVESETQAPTVPLKLGQEKRTNPFLLCHDPRVQAFTGKTVPHEVFGEVRTRKDNFR
jgi:hydroxyacylglutathione hydrolase